MPEAVLHTESFPEGYRLTATAERCWTCSARTVTPCVRSSGLLATILILFP